MPMKKFESRRWRLELELGGHAVVDNESDVTATFSADVPLHGSPEPVEMLADKDIPLLTWRLSIYSVIS